MSAFFPIRKCFVAGECIPFFSFKTVVFYVFNIKNTEIELPDGNMLTLYYHIDNEKLYGKNEYEDDNYTTITVDGNTDNVWLIENNGINSELYKISIADNTVENLLEDSNIEQMNVAIYDIQLSDDAKKALLKIDYSKGSTLDGNNRDDIDTSCEYYVYDCITKQGVSLNEFFGSKVCFRDTKEYTDIKAAKPKFSGNDIVVLSTEIETGINTLLTSSSDGKISSYTMDINGNINSSYVSGTTSVIIQENELFWTNTATGEKAKTNISTFSYGIFNESKTKLFLKYDECKILNIDNGLITTIHNISSNNLIFWINDELLTELIIEYDDTGDTMIQINVIEQKA